MTTVGGARIRSGVEPDPAALRRDDEVRAWLKLPSSPRKGPAPAWPLDPATASERRLWNHLWKTPQAVIWETAHEDVAVALLVRTISEAYGPKPPSGSQTLVRQYLETLGLAGALLRNRHWSIEAVERPTIGRPDPRTPRRSARARLQLMPEDQP